MAVDGAMPYEAAWRFGGQRRPPPERALLGVKVVDLRNGVIRVVGDRTVGPDSGKTSGCATYLYSSDRHAIDRRISAMRVAEAGEVQASSAPACAVPTAAATTAPIGRPGSVRPPGTAAP